MKTALMPAMSIEDAKKRNGMINQFVRDIMNESIDYGKVGDTKKGTLLKPGAEKLAVFFGLCPTLSMIEKVEDWTGQKSGGEPFFFYHYKCSLFREGNLIGEGIGSCNSWEAKYRYRWIDDSQMPYNIDPKTLNKKQTTIIEFEFAINKRETSGKYGKPVEYWDAFQTAIASGDAKKTTKDTYAKGPQSAWSISSVLYRVPNEGVFDQINTVDKMAQKRAFVSSVLMVVGVSDFFTQDLEDFNSTSIASSVASKTSPPKTDDFQESTSAPPKTNGAKNPTHDFWAYQREVDIDKDYALQVLGDSDGDFEKALQRLEEEFDGDDSRDDQGPHPLDFGDN